MTLSPLKVFGQDLSFMYSADRIVTVQCFRKDVQKVMERPCIILILLLVILGHLVILFMYKLFANPTI